MSIPNKLLQVGVRLKEMVSILQIPVQLSLPLQPLDVFGTHKVAVPKAASAQSTAENTPAFWLLLHTYSLRVSPVTT
jgi:hypothetical protein